MLVVVVVVVKSPRGVTYTFSFGLGSSIVYFIENLTLNPMVKSDLKLVRAFRRWDRFYQSKVTKTPLV